jgi:predicted acyltransferase
MKRLQSIDALRGFDMLFIMGFAGFLAALCATMPCGFTDAIAGSMKHAEWNGLRHHDTIFPLFLFIAGMTYPFSYEKQLEKGTSRGRIYLKILKRTLILILLGVIYNGLFKLDFGNIRIASVLGRIGLAWGIAAILFINFGVTARIVIASVLLVGYGLVSALVGAPDVPNADPLSMEGCFAGYFDRMFLPGHLYEDTFDPEGLFSAFSAVVTAMLGMFTGEFIKRADISGNKKTIYMFIAAAILIGVGVAFSPVLPLNKKLWSSTFVLVVGGYSVAMYALFYYLIEVKNWQKWSECFQVIGLNSITIYMGMKIIDFKHISGFFLNGIASKCPDLIADVINGAGYVAICWLFLYFLYHKKVFLKI